MSTANLEDVAARLPGRVRYVRNGLRSPCPAHGGDGENLSVFVGADGRPHAKCHSHGCGTREVFAALGLEVITVSREALPTPPDPELVTFAVTSRWGTVPVPLFGAKVPEGYSHTHSYRYENADGGLVGVVDRFELCRDGERTAKRFSQRVPSPKGWQFWLEGRVFPLYRLPEVLARPEGVPIIVTEGEKDVHQLLTKLPGYIVTTNPGGADGWKRVHTRQLLHATNAEPRVPILLMPDCDAAGDKWVASIQTGLGRWRTTKVLRP